MRVAKVIFAFAAAICLLGLAVVAGRWGQADLELFPIGTVLARLAGDGTRNNPGNNPRDNPGLGGWLKARENLLVAQALEPGSPVILETLGLVHARVTESGGSQWFEEQAMEYFKQAIVLRPTSPYSWSNFAVTRYKVGQADAELQRALANAAVMGPWEPEVQFVVGDLGFALWDEIPPALQKSVIENVGRGMKRYDDNMVRIAEKRGRLMLACQSSADALKHSKCRKLLNAGM